MLKEEHFLLCEALSGKPTMGDEIGKVSIGAGIFILYHPRSGWSQLKCPFLDYDSKEHDQLLRFLRPSIFFFLKITARERERKRGRGTINSVIRLTYLERLQVNFKYLFNDL